MHRDVWQFASREEPRGNKRTEARWERRQLGPRRIKASLWLRNLLRGKPWGLNPFFCFDSSQKEAMVSFYRNTPRLARSYWHHYHIFIVMWSLVSTSIKWWFYRLLQILSRRVKPIHGLLMIHTCFKSSCSIRSSGFIMVLPGVVSLIHGKKGISLDKPERVFIFVFLEH